MCIGERWRCDDDAAGMQNLPPMTALLHVIAQEAHHDDAYIGGNRGGLTALRDAINMALRLDCGVAQAFCADGEGYGCVVQRATDEQMQEIPEGYADEHARSEQKIPRWVTR